MTVMMMMMMMMMMTTIKITVITGKIYIIIFSL